MKQLLLMRHAKSSWDNAELADHDRPLNKRGRRDAPRMGKWLCDQGVIPGRIISSTAVRARKTAAVVAEACGMDDHLELDRSLYFGDVSEWVALIAETDSEIQSVMLVGHNPGLEDFLEHLIGHYERLPTATVACVELPIDAWQNLSTNSSGRLLAIWRPKELP